MSDVYQAPEASLSEPVSDGQYGSIEGALAGDYKIKPIEVVKDAWANLKGMKTTFWLAFLVYYIVAIVFAGVISLVFVGFAMLAEDSPTLFVISQVILQVIQLAVFMPMAMGIAMIALKHSVGAKLEINEIFKHFNKALPLLLAYILMTIAIMIGSVLLIIPGIYLMVAYAMTMMLVVEKDMGVWQAMELSRKAVTKQWFGMFGFFIVALIIFILGAIPLFIGLIWVMPLLTLAYVTIYRDMFGVESKTMNG